MVNRCEYLTLLVSFLVDGTLTETRLRLKAVAKTPLFPQLDSSMPRATSLFLVLLLAAFGQTQAHAVLVTHSFGFPTMVGPDVAIGAPLTHTIFREGKPGGMAGLDVDITFSLTITSANGGTVVHRGGSGGLGVDSVGDTNSTIDIAGEDLTFVLGVSTSDPNPDGGNITPTKLSFGSVTLRFIGNDNDNGSFGAFSGTTGPGAPDTGPPTVYEWTKGTLVSDFPGHTPGDPLASFDLFRMNGDVVTTFTHFYGTPASTNRFLFNGLNVGVVAAPEPSSWMLGGLIALIILFRLGWKRFRPITRPQSSIA